MIYRLIASVIIVFVYDLYKKKQKKIYQLEQKKFECLPIKPIPIPCDDIVLKHGELMQNQDCKNIEDLCDYLVNPDKFPKERTPDNDHYERIQSHPFGMIIECCIKTCPMSRHVARTRQSLETWVVNHMLRSQGEDITLFSYLPGGLLFELRLMELFMRSDKGVHNVTLVLSSFAMRIACLCKSENCNGYQSYLFDRFQHDTSVTLRWGLRSLDREQSSKEPNFIRRTQNLCVYGKYMLHYLSAHAKHHGYKVRFQQNLPATEYGMFTIAMGVDLADSRYDGTDRFLNITRDADLSICVNHQEGEELNASGRLHGLSFRVEGEKVFSELLEVENV